MKKLLLVFVLFVSVSFSGTAFATMIDFTDASWQAADGLSSYSASGITLSANSGSTLWHNLSDGDGIGIRSGYDPDEIDGSDVLQVTFDSTVTLDTIYVADLFYNECRNGGNGQYCYNEIGYYSLDGVSWTTFTALSTNTSNGEMSIAIGQAVTSFWLKAPGKIGDPVQDHEFSLQKLAYTSVPEPSVMLLLGSGLFGVAFFSRFRRTV